ncbi:MAG: hypothetical protein QM765_26480 [Myxococcales bacterium]
MKPVVEGAAQDELAAELVERTWEVVHSKRFRDNFLSLRALHPRLWLAPRGDTVCPEQAVGALMEEVGWERRVEAVTVLIVQGGGGVETASTEIVASADGRLKAVMRLGRSAVTRWECGGMAASCAINTVAHELTHTVASPDGAELFADRGVTYAEMRDRQLVSYFVGAVAQCTYLQLEAERAGKSHDLADCIRKVGTRRMNASLCLCGVEQ